MLLVTLACGLSLAEGWSAPLHGQGARAAPRAAATVRTDGQWNLALETVYNGRTLTSNMTQCVTREQARDPMNTLPGGPEAQRGCQMSDYRVVDQTVTWSIRCEGPPVATTRGEYVYKANSYVGVMTMQRNGQTIKTRINGTRVGDCAGPLATPGR